MMVFIWLIVLLCAVHAQQEIRIGGILTLPTFDALVKAAEMAVSDINNDQSVLPGYNLVLDMRNTSGSGSPVETALSHVDYFVNTAPVAMLFGPAYSSLTLPTAARSSNYSLIQLSPLSADPALANKTIYPYFFRLMANVMEFSPAVVGFIQHFGWKNVAIIKESRTPYDALADAVNADLKKAGVNVGTVATYSDSDPAAALSEILATEIKVIFVSTFQSKYKFIMCEAFKKGMYGSKYLWIKAPSPVLNMWEFYGRGDVPSDCTAQEVVSSMEGDVHLWVQDLLDLDAEPELKDTVSGRDAKAFVDDIRSSTPFGFRDAILTQSYDAIWSIALALNNSLPALPGNPGTKMERLYGRGASEIISSEMKKMKFTGLSGHVAFKASGDREGDIVIQQVINGTIESHIAVSHEENGERTLIFEMSDKEIWQSKGGVKPVDLVTGSGGALLPTRLCVVALATSSLLTVMAAVLP
ncbi:gamma-aminobutyric acid type B receptor subunit 1-like [Lingula anatina]|uniref:Gamma-aminobutyric acid type B receptor subunit 1-like n=1 Tax=Lingula anatina TaxID=7574 RepID=A0A1S3HT94_LINAN|nr:gamma-aminobutyric acid type B receptor subunit 1-like [Lingula anatina]XP_013388279.1 gamma-aminobutyric acid type B receptor subunit 1-like [Lingula anatina]|eukprot:XP_013388278.1 gamma-aminobutyric acid type B receptor subunit 1-like [Lingula anatina]